MIVEMRKKITDILHVCEQNWLKKMAEKKLITLNLACSKRAMRKIDVLTLTTEINVLGTIERPYIQPSLINV